MDCFGTYFTHAQSCDNVRVHSATEWTASVHTLRMPKAVITFMFKVLQEGLLRYIHMPKAVTTFVFKVLRSGLCFRRFRVFAVFAFSFFSRFRAWRFRVFAFSRFRVPPAAPPRPGHRFRVHSGMLHAENREDTSWRSRVDNLSLMKLRSLELYQSRQVDFFLCLTFDT